MAVNGNTFPDILQDIELHNIFLPLSKNTTCLFVTTSRGSKHKSLLLFLIGTYTQAGNMTRIPAQQLGVDDVNPSFCKTIHCDGCLAACMHAFTPLLSPVCS